jgi:hypothetical protein
VVQFADVGNTLRCVVTATNAIGVASANSNNTSTVADMPFGTAYLGGYYVGRIVVSGATYAVLTAPKSSGESSGRQWRTSNASGPAATITLNNGFDASASMNNAEYTAAQFCEGLSIGGYTDWYLPSRDELELCYRNLKTRTNASNPNDTSTRELSAYTYPQGTDVSGNVMGTNLNSSPNGGAYTSGVPSQTSNTDFQSGGTQAFADGPFWSSSEFSATQGWGQNFQFGGVQYSENKFVSAFARAVRRVAI